MKASELRVGNWIYRSFTKEDVKILGINAYETVSDGIVNSLSFKNGINLYCENISVLKPIPLTEEWLLKFGFEKMNRTIYNSPNSKIFSLNGFFIKHYKRLDIDYYECKIGYVKLEYVHQLQNLIFALTNTELQTT